MHNFRFFLLLFNLMVWSFPLLSYELSARAPDEYVYHGSSRHHLKELRPSISRHGVNWIYATPFLAVATSFMIEANDFDFIFTFNDEGIYSIVERYKGALNLYHREGSIYTLPSNDFLSHQTPSELEVVNSQPVRVLEELYVDDILQFLVYLEGKGQLKLYHYPHRPSHVPIDDRDLIDIALSWKKANMFGVEKQFFRLHPHLKERYTEKTSKLGF